MALSGAIDTVEPAADRIAALATSYAAARAEINAKLQPAVAG